MFANGSYAKLWKYEKGNGNYYVAQMSTSQKNRDGKYETDWSDGRVRIVGAAVNQIEGVSAGQTIRIERCGVTNRYDKEKKTTYTNYVVFDFSPVEQNNSNNRKDTQTAGNESTAVDAELPFT